MEIQKQIKELLSTLPENVSLVAVSKTKPNEDLEAAYEAGQRIFGENKIQEMTQKWESLPKDIEWHMIGHVQTNKVKYMAPYRFKNKPTPKYSHKRTNGNGNVYKQRRSNSLGV
jgi:uncharacterized pyridoxal phosphate-containing UPF0001 family protein